MSKVVCCPPELIPTRLDAGVEYFSMYKSSGREDVNSVGTNLFYNVERVGICPDACSWDFVTFALAISAADLSISRVDSPDGWTRVIELSVALVDPIPFEQQCTKLEEMLRFLTGDFWDLCFIDGGMNPPRSTAPKTFDADCVSLLSGGVDSLVGAIDLTAQGKRPLFVSQMAKGDSDTQLRYAKLLGGADRHLQWNHNIRVHHETERSTRGRSIIFFAFAALGVNALHAQTKQLVNVYVPENGFISLNVPLNSGRRGSLSTKTTHPVFLARLQEVWDTLKLPGRLIRPYEYLTKGELMAQCKDQKLLTDLVADSTSCGRFGYYNYTHCGRCVPCMVRRASFIRAGLHDPTTYVFDDLSKSARKSGPNDIGAVAVAVKAVQTLGVRTFTAGQFAFAEPSRRKEFEGVIERGLAELQELLHIQHVL